MVSSRLLVVSVFATSGSQSSGSFRPGSPCTSGPSSKLSFPSSLLLLPGDLAPTQRPRGSSRAPPRSAPSFGQPGHLQLLPSSPSAGSVFWATRPPPEAPEIPLGRRPCFRLFPTTSLIAMTASSAPALLRAEPRVRPLPFGQSLPVVLGPRPLPIVLGPRPLPLGHEESPASCRIQEQSRTPLVVPGFYSSETSAADSMTSIGSRLHPDGLGSLLPELGGCPSFSLGHGTAPLSLSTVPKEPHRLPSASNRPRLPSALGLGQLPLTVHVPEAFSSA